MTRARPSSAGAAIPIEAYVGVTAIISEPKHISKLEAIVLHSDRSRRGLIYPSSCCTQFLHQVWAAHRPVVPVLDKRTRQDNGSQPSRIANEVSTSGPASRTAVKPGGQDMQRC